MIQIILGMISITIKIGTDDTTSQFWYPRLACAIVHLEDIDASFHLSFRIGAGNLSLSRPCVSLMKAAGS
jgi:hypothetical protein